MSQSGFNRMLGVLVAPAKAFAAIAERPTWVVALITLIAVSVMATVVVTPRIDMEKVMRDQIAQSGRQVPNDVLDRQIEFAQKFRWVFAAVGLVAQPVIYLLVALVFWVLFRMLGSELDFQRSFAVAVHGFLPGALAGLLSLPVILSQTTLDYERMRSGSFLFSNPGAFLGPDTAKPLVALLSSFDVFSIWSVVLLAIGYRIVGKVSRAAAVGGVVALWAVYVLGKVGISAIF